MSIETIRRCAEFASAGPGNEQERLALLEAHRGNVTVKPLHRSRTSSSLTTRSVSTETGTRPESPTSYGRQRVARGR